MRAWTSSIQARIVRASVFFEEDMSDTRPSVTIRMPAQLMEKIKATAAGSGRSMNAEIVWHLEEAFKPRKIRLSTDEDEKTRAQLMTLAKAIIQEYGQDGD